VSGPVTEGYNPITRFDHPHSRSFLSASAFEVMLGGGRGAGKSVDLIGHTVTPDATGKRPRIAHPAYRGLVLRRSMPQLKELIDISFRIIPFAVPGAEFMWNRSEWRLPAGGRLEMAFLEHDEQKQRYWGRGYHDLLIDELEHWPHEDTYLWLHSSVRSAEADLPCYVRCTANPTGPGAIWVRRRFVDPAPYGTIIRAAKIEGYRGLRQYIHAVPKDNKYLQDDYIQGLRALPSHLNRAFEHGDWSATDGVFFSAWNTDLHVCEPFPIPLSAPRIRGIDWGYHDKSVVLWAAEVGGGLVIYRELAQAGLSPDELAKKIVKLERDAGEYPVQGPLDAQCWQTTGIGFTIAERFIKCGVRVYRSAKGPNSRVHGAAEMHRRLTTVYTLKDGEGGEHKIPAIRFFDCCRYSIRTIPALVADPHNAEDVLTGGDDHAWDCARYLLRARPLGRKEAPKIVSLADRERPRSFEERWRSRRRRTA